ncbi:MAG: PP2C family protein-serine/threonine phosphatase [Planctomycetota bacterium]
MSDETLFADVGRVVGDPGVQRLLRGTALLRGVRVVVGDRDRTVLAAFGRQEGTPAEFPEDSDGTVSQRLEVYDRLSGWVWAGPEDGAADPDPEGAAKAAVDLVGALATKDYESESLSQSLLDSFEEINLFYGITARIHAVGSNEGICATILDRACEIMGSKRASILLADSRTGVLRIVASRGIPEEQVARVRVQPGEGVTGKVMNSGQIMLVDDTATNGDNGGREGRYSSRSFISVPLQVFDPAGTGAMESDQGVMKPLGVLNMTDKADHGRFTARDLKLLSALASQAAVLLENNRLTGIAKELALAKNIQASLLPQRAPSIAGAELGGVCEPAHNVGGDYYDMVELPDGRAGLLIADVSGHNVGAALMMAVSRAALRAEIFRGEEPDAVLATVNRLLDGDLSRAELFVSVFYAVYDPASGTLTYANAGHNLPFLLREGSEEVEELDANGILFGVLPDYEFECKTVTLSPGDLLLLYTDGFTEASDTAGEMFGEGRLAGVLVRERRTPMEELPRAILRDVDAFSAEAAQDDRTAVMLRAGPLTGSDT